MFALRDVRRLYSVCTATLSGMIDYMGTAIVHILPTHRLKYGSWSPGGSGLVRTVMSSGNRNILASRTILEFTRSDVSSMEIPDASRYQKVIMICLLLLTVRTLPWCLRRCVD